MTRVTAIILILASGLLGACGGADSPSAGNTDQGEAPSSAPTTSDRATVTMSPSPETSGGAGVRLKVADSDFGRILFDGSGQAIYLFDRERTERPACYGDCAEAWPPVLTSGSPRITAGVRSDLVATTRRRDGTTQVTYAGHPLYYYAHEGKNQVLCHNVSEFGGLWLVVTPSGESAA